MVSACGHLRRDLCKYPCGYLHNASGIFCHPRVGDAFLCNQNKYTTAYGSPTSYGYMDLMIDVFFYTERRAVQ